MTILKHSDREYSKGSDGVIIIEMLFIELEKEATIPLYEQIYEQIRHDITEGKLSVGMKLPSKRKLGEFLNVSQTTIEYAYGQLTAEGFISSIPRKGFFVQAIEELAYVQPMEQLPKLLPIEPKTITIDFSPGDVDTDSFPFTKWRKYARDVIDESSKDLLLLGDPHGDFELRTEIAQYLYHSRGVDCTPEQVIVGSGTEQLLPLLIRILGTDAIYAIEDPGYLLTHHVFIHNNRDAIPIPVDKEGMDVHILQNSIATVAYLTPSHQFPTGTVLSAARRTALLNWASAKDTHFIIEDDYDSEFRYAGRPIPALQGMDKGENVIYLSTFSKSLMPSLRIAYMVLPNVLLTKYRNAFIHYASTVPRLDQHILARFMENGQFSRHLNKMRTTYRRKLEVLLNALQPYAPYISYSGEEAGMHIIITVITNKSEEQLTEAAANIGIQLNGLTKYRTQQVVGPPSFLIGFGGLSPETIKTGIDTLMSAWNIKRSSAST